MVMILWSRNRVYSIGMVLVEGQEKINLVAQPEEEEIVEPLNEPIIEIPQVKSVEVKPAENNNSEYRNYAVKFILPVPGENGATTEMEVKFTARYSKLNEANKILGDNTITSLFPPKHLFRDYKNNLYNVQERARDLQCYFEKALENVEILTNKSWHQAIGLTSFHSTYVTELGQLIIRKTEEYNRQKQKIIKYAFYFAKTFHHSIPINAPVSIFTVPIPLSFCVFGGSLNYKIEGPEGKDWFFFKSSSAQAGTYALTNINGTPLMIIEKVNAERKVKKFKLSRVGLDGEIPWCEIAQRIGAREDPDEITVNRLNDSCPNIQFEGSWISERSLFIEEYPTVTIETKKKHEDTHFVTIEAGKDVVLYLALTLAIEKMSQATVIVSMTT